MSKLLKYEMKFFYLVPAFSFAFGIFAFILGVVGKLNTANLTYNYFSVIIIAYMMTISVYKLFNMKLYNFTDKKSSEIFAAKLVILFVMTAFVMLIGCLSVTLAQLVLVKSGKQLIVYSALSRLSVFGLYNSNATCWLIILTTALSVSVIFTSIAAGYAVKKISSRCEILFGVLTALIMIIVFFLFSCIFSVYFANAYFGDGCTKLIPSNNLSVTNFSAANSRSSTPFYLLAFDFQNILNVFMAAVFFIIAFITIKWSDGRRLVK